MDSHTREGEQGAGMLRTASTLPLNCNYAGPKGALVRTIRINNMLLSMYSLTCQPSWALVGKGNARDPPSIILPRPQLHADVISAASTAKNDLAAAEVWLKDVNADCYQ